MKKYMKTLKKYHMIEDNHYQYLEEKTFHQGEYLLHQGQKLDYIYILMKGRLKTYHTNSNGTVMLSGFSYPISILGEIEFIDQSLVHNDIIADIDCECIRISVLQYRDIFIKDSLFIKQIALNLANKLSKANHNTSISLKYPVENRLASYLIASQNDGIIYDNFVTVAEIIGCSYRQLQRVLQDFTKKQYIKKIKKGVYKLLDIDTLKKLGQDVYRL